MSVADERDRTNKTNPETLIIKNLSVAMDRACRILESENCVCCSRNESWSLVN